MSPFNFTAALCSYCHFLHFIPEEIEAREVKLLNSWVSSLQMQLNSCLSYPRVIWTIRLAPLALEPETDGELLNMAIWTSYLKQVFLDVAFHNAGSGFPSLWFEFTRVVEFLISVLRASFSLQYKKASITQLPSWDLGCGNWLTP